MTVSPEPSEEFREAFIRRMTVDSAAGDRRRKDFNQAIFMSDGCAVWSATDLGMVLRCYDNAVKDVKS